MNRAKSRLIQVNPATVNPPRHGPQFFISRPAILRQYGSMGKRREARERAVQYLFQHELNPPDNLELELAQFWNSQRAAAIEDEKGAAKWNEVTELPPPTVEEAEKGLILRTLEHTGNNKTRAAEILGISLKTLHNKLKEYSGG